MGRRSLTLEAISLWKANEGTAAVEFALCAALLLVPLFLGTVSLGLATWTKMQVDNAARAGAAYAAKYGYDLPSGNKIQQAAQNATALSTNVAVTPVLTLLSCTDPATGQISLALNGLSTCPATGSPPGVYVIVNTTFSYSLIFPIPGVANVNSLSGKAIARIS